LREDKALIAYYHGGRPKGDESGDDIGFMNKLAYWCNHNTALMRAAFISSPYFGKKDPKHQAKWKREDYSNDTIAEAIAGTPITAKDKDAQYMADRRAATVEGFKDNPLGHQGAAAKRTSDGYAVEVIAPEEPQYIKLSEVEIKVSCCLPIISPKHLYNPAISFMWFRVRTFNIFAASLRLYKN